MARVVFIQDIAYEYMGVMYISSYLKRYNHDCVVLIESIEKDLFSKLESLKPDIFGFSTLSGSFKWAIEVATKLKTRFAHVPIVFGGVHVYQNPDKVLNCAPVDIICTGEGELPLKEVCDSLDKGETRTDVNGLWFKTTDGIIKNPMTKLIDDLDNLPFPDRLLYWRYPAIESRDTMPLLGSRGCPYTCTYCFIPKAKEIFAGQGQFVRQRSAENILEEIEQCLKLSNKKKVIHFVEDHFGNNRTRTLQVLRSLSQLNHKVKWAGAIRIERFMEENYVQELAKTNHSFLGLAIECGNEKYRNEVLQREVRNEDIIKAADLATKYGIRFVTLNMVGLPGETYEMALETLELNLRVKPEYANCFVYQPYPGSKLQEYGVEHQFYKESVVDELGFSFYDRYNYDNREFQKVINLQRVFGLIVWFPILKKPLVWLGNKRGTGKLFDAIFGIYYLFYMKKYFDLSASQILQYIMLWIQSQYRRKKDPVTDTIAKGKGQFYSPKQSANRVIKTKTADFENIREICSTCLA